MKKLLKYITISTVGLLGSQTLPADANSPQAYEQDRTVEKVVLGLALVREKPVICALDKRHFFKV